MLFKWALRHIQLQPGWDKPSRLFPQQCFMLPQSLGVIGGKPNSAHYFIGYVGMSRLCVCEINARITLTILISLPRREQPHLERIVSFLIRGGAHLLRPAHHAARGGAVWRQPGPWWDIPLSAPALPHAHLWTGPIHRSGRNARDKAFSISKLKLIVKNMNVSRLKCWHYSDVP